MASACCIISGCAVRGEYQEYSNAGTNYTRSLPPLFTLYKEYYQQRTAIIIANNLNNTKYNNISEKNVTTNSYRFDHNFCPTVTDKDIDVSQIDIDKEDSSLSKINSLIDARDMNFSYKIFLKEYCSFKNYENQLNNILLTNSLMGQYFDALSELIDNKSPDIIEAKINSIVENIVVLTKSQPPKKRLGGVLGFILNLAINNTVKDIITDNSNLIERTVENQNKILKMMEIRISNDQTLFTQYYANKLNALHKNTTEYEDVLSIMTNYQEKISSLKSNISLLIESAEELKKLNSAIGEKGISPDTILNYLKEVSKLKKSI